MFEYRHVGELVGAEPERRLLLPVGRPLSYLRVATSPAGEPGRTIGLTRALLEHRASEFRLRIPFLTEPGGRATVKRALTRFALSPVFPVLLGQRATDDALVDVCWLDWVQMSALGRELGSGFGAGDPVRVAGMELRPTYASVPAGGGPIERSWQYWNSAWEFVPPAPAREGWWRVRPNESRDRPLLPRLRKADAGFGPQARGTFAACLHPRMRRMLGGPRYVVVRHPYRDGWLPILVIEDDFRDSAGGETDERVWNRTIFLDRTARDALGIADGEFCLLYPWLRPRRSLWYRRFRDRVAGSRTIAAHVRAPARADLEKPVCRLEPAALEAIGGAGSEFVVVERVAPPRGKSPSHTWERIHMSQRVLPIDPKERAERDGWEANQLWDDDSTPPQEGREAPRLEGYVDCAERLGVHPPYPTIYLNYYARQRLRGVGLCQPVQARVSIPGRILSEASEFIWLAVIALLGAAIAFLDSTLWRVVAAVLLLTLTVLLLLFRTIRAIR